MPLADRYDSFLFDLDGVLYRGDQAVDHAVETIERLRAAGKGLAFVTNNSSRTREQVAEKLTGMGIRTAAEEVVTSAVATAELLSRERVARAFVIGEAGIREALQQRGIELVDGPADHVDVVVVGWDRSADYEKLKRAALLVQRGARLVATNGDASYPAPDGLWPGAGALLAAVTTTAGAVPEVVGKPHAPLFELARERAGGGAALSIGDRLDTDVAGALRLGWDSLLVFTGVTHPANLVRTDDLPTFVGRDAAALFGPAAGIRAAEPGDAGSLRSLLDGAGLEPGPEGGLSTATWVAADADAGAIVGTVALERAGSDAHLRSLAVADDRRDEGLGTLLVAHAVREARRSGAAGVFIATETAEGFFGGLGFVGAGALDALPPAFRKHMTACADTAAVMRLTP